MPQLAEKKTGIQVGETLEEMSHSASRLKSSLSDAAENNLYRVRRAVRRIWYSARDRMDNAAYKVKRHPFEAITIAAGAGFTIGLLVGWAVNRD